MYILTRYSNIINYWKVIGMTLARVLCVNFFVEHDEKTDLFDG